MTPLIKKITVFMFAGIFIISLPKFIFAETEKESKPAMPMKPSLPRSLPLKKDGQDIDKIVQTLNDTLTENRSLHTEMLKNEDELKKEKSKTDILIAQVKELQGELAKSDDKAGVQDTALEKKKSDIQSDRDRLAEEKKNFESLKAEAKKESKAVEDENARLRELLNQSILKSERDQFMSLLKKTEDDSNRAVLEFAKTKRENEKMKQELAAQYYDLGNALVEKAHYDLAIKKYRKALELNPNDSWSHHNLGVVYDFYLNDMKKALYHYRQYLHLKPVSEQAGEIRERVLEMELGKIVTPKLPLKMDFDQYQKDLKNVK